MKIFFDVDGVLMNNIHMERGWLDRWDKDIEKDLGISSARIQEIFSTWFPEVIKGRLDFETEMARWLKSHDYTVPAVDVIAYWNEKDMNLNMDLWPAVRKLSQNPDIHLYVATNQSHARAEYLWNNVFKDYFKKIFYSAELGCIKHDEEYFRLIEEDLGINTAVEPVLFFDDDKRNIESSSKRGWQSVYFHTVRDCLTHPLIKPLLAA
jgi:HAD superfamily hydrolase (TIGR01509 family)